MAKNGINATEYMYSSARLRSLEARLCGTKGIDLLLATSSYEEALLKLSDLGVELVRDESGEVLLEESLVGILENAFSEVVENCPDPHEFDFLRYAYDCNNLKAVLKCNAKGISPDSMLYACGTIPTDEVKKAAVEEIESCPKNMRTAVSEAIEAYAKTRNPQQIDIILDRACFSDMLEGASGRNCELSKKLVMTRITLINLMMCVRLLRMNMGEVGKKMLEASLLSGGDLDREFYMEAYEGGMDMLCDRLEYTEYCKLLADGGGALSLAQIERRADEIYLALARGAKFVPFGPEVALGYLVGCEYDVKNIRIVMSAKRSGIDNETVKERLRGSYV